MTCVLCIDDNPVFLDSMVMRLAAEGYLVDRALDVRSALELFATSPFKYDVVVTDMAFPSDLNGQVLVDRLVELREVRGFDAGPEIICLTGDARMAQSSLANSYRDRGFTFVLKGNDQYALEVKAAAERLEKLRGLGPGILIIHEGADDYRWDNNQPFGCMVGELVKQVFVLHSGGRAEVDMKPAPRRVFDFLARRTQRRPFALEEVVDGFNLDEFYNYWQEEDKTVTKDSVKNNVLRIRRALDITFEGLRLPYRGTDIVTTQLAEDRSEPSWGNVQLRHRQQFQTVDINALQAPGDRDERYSVKARIYVEHIPRSSPNPQT